MTYFLVALVVAAISSLPAFLAKRAIVGILALAVLTPVLWWLFYANAVGFAGPMFGPALFIVAIGSTIVAVITGVTDNDNGRNISLGVLPVPVTAWLALVGISFAGSEFLNASEYHALVGNMEKRVWTQDIQPKDPAHFRPVPQANALYVARKAVGELGTVGSQFDVREDSITLQAIKGELWYVIPLDFTGYRAWNNAGTAIGYIMVHAEDPNQQPVVKQLKKNDQFVYTPGAWFGNDLIRHLRLSGNLRVGLRGTHLEIDDNDKPWWVTAVTEPTIGQYGDKVKGVYITDPVTGDSQFAAIGNVPQWVDRVMPRKLLRDYLDYWGEYVTTWWNAFWQKRDLTEPEVPSLVYSSEHDPVFVTGITSRNNNDDSLIGVVYTHTRTGKSVFYEVKGGATDTAVLNAIAKNQEVQFKHLHAQDPQLYNLYGTMASIAPLLNDNYAYQGIAIANISNVQQVAVGRNLGDAIRQYQRLLGQSGDLAHVEKEHQTKVVEGKLVRVKQDLTQSGSVYYLVVDGTRKGFIGGSAEFPELPFADVGDAVRIEYYASDESIVPIRTYTNLTLKLDKSDAEKSVETRKTESREANEAKPVRRDVETLLKDAKPEDLNKIRDALRK